MNWGIVAAGCSLFGVVCTLLMGAYNSGKFTERLNNNDKRADKHERRLDGHDQAIGELDVKVGQFDKWTEGYNAASRVSVSREPNPIL